MPSYHMGFSGRQVLILAQRFVKYTALFRGVKTIPAWLQGFNKVHNYVTLRERSSATEESRSL